MLSPEQLFEVKKKFLSTVPHPQIIRKYVSRLLGDKVEEILFSTNSESGLIDFLQAYTPSVLQLRLEISNAQTGTDLGETLVKLERLHKELIFRLSELELDVDLSNTETIKLSGELDAHKVLKFLQQNDIDDTEINGYLRSQKVGSEEENSVLVNTVIRAKKIIGNG